MNEQTELKTDSEKIGRRKMSTGSMGIGRFVCRMTKATPSPTEATSWTTTAMAPWPCAMPSMPLSSRPKVSAHSRALGRSNGCGVGSVTGRVEVDNRNATTPSGTAMANSHCQGPSARMAAATVGPSAAEVATTMALSPMARPSASRG